MVWQIIIIDTTICPWSNVLLIMGVTIVFYIFQNPTAKVIDVKSKTKSKWRPVALDTVVNTDH